MVGAVRWWCDFHVLRHELPTSTVQYSLSQTFTFQVSWASFPFLIAFVLGASVLSFACSSRVGGMLLGVSDLLLVLLFRAGGMLCKSDKPSIIIIIII